MDVRRILATIREVDEWTRRKQELEARMQALPRHQRRSMRAELEIVQVRSETMALSWRSSGSNWPTTRPWSRR